MKSLHTGWVGELNPMALLPPGHCLLVPNAPHGRKAPGWAQHSGNIHNIHFIPSGAACTLPWQLGDVILQTDECLVCETASAPVSPTSAPSLSWITQWKQPWSCCCWCALPLLLPGSFSPSKFCFHMGKTTTVFQMGKKLLQNEPKQRRIQLLVTRDKQRFGLYIEIQRPYSHSRGFIIPWNYLEPAATKKSAFYSSSSAAHHCV